MVALDRYPQLLSRKQVVCQNPRRSLRKLHGDTPAIALSTAQIFEPNTAISVKKFSKSCGLALARRGGDAGSGLALARRGGDAGSGLALARRGGDAGSELALARRGVEAGSELALAARRGVEAGSELALARRRPGEPAARGVAPPS
jgi:hypothetical protein